MRHVCFRVAVALLAFSRPLAAQSPLDSASLGAWLDSLVPSALKEGDIAGAVVVVVKDGRILLEKGYGLADVQRKVPMDPRETVISVGSVSKLFTWTAAMQQVQLGKLDLDRDINQDLGFRIPDAFGKRITLRDLMTHTAGFEERGFRTYKVPRALKEHLEGTAVPERIFPPGEVVAYSNYGSMLAGHMVERASGETFVDYIDRHIFQPLGMQHSSFRRPPRADLAPKLARSYPVASGDPDPIDALDHEEPSGDPSGHLMTTGEDMSRFMIAHLQRGRLENVELLSPEIADQMHAAVVEPIPGGNPITLGFWRGDRNGHRIIGHGGDIESFHADVKLLPDDGIGYFMVVNSDGASRGLFGAGHLLRTALFNRFLDRFFPPPAEVDLPTAPTAMEHARLVAGEYQMSRRGAHDFAEAEMLLQRVAMHLVIKAHDDGTIETPPLLDFERGQVRRWREVEPFHWREVGGDGWLDAKVVNGRVIALLPRDLYSFVLQPISWTKAARGNLVFAVVALVILVIAAIVARPKPIRIAAIIGTLYLLSWGILLSSGVTTKEGGETWIRLAQVLGLVAIVAIALAIREAAQVIGQKPGWLKAIASILVMLAMLEVVWLSFGFHLLSLKLIY
ncbi:MAG TPA: serine hydrolase domain-containing protein [Gemmatimonadales bacterium]|nr:serine hydrolase domain-containing protein [Gemmatimonadales bacterium]